MAQKIPFFELFTDFSPDFDLRVPLNAAMVTNMVLEPEKRTMTLDMTVRAEMTDATRETVEQMLARSYDLKRVNIRVKSTAEAFPDMMKNAGRKVSGSGSVILGREIAKGRVLPISELTPKAGHVVVEGKVFKFDCHETRRAGVNVSNCIRLHGHSTATYLAIANKQEETILAINDTHILQQLTPQLLNTSRDLIRHAGVVLADCNLTPEALEWVFTIADEIPMFVDTVSEFKAGDQGY